MPDSLTGVSFLVPAAGCGSRANLGGNKILAPLRGEPVLLWTLRALAHPDAIPPGCTCSEIIIAARRDEWSLVEPILARLNGRTRAKTRLVEGGATRQDSVRSLVRAARGDVVAVHDAARPLLSSELSSRVIQAALQCGAALAALPASDTIKTARLDEAGHAVVASTLDRGCVWLAQTPQAFRHELLLQALDIARRDHFQGTDCASLLEHWREAEPDAQIPDVHLVEGQAINFKITFAADLERAERELQVLAEAPKAA